MTDRDARRSFFGAALVAELASLRTAAGLTHHQVAAVLGVADIDMVSIESTGHLSTGELDTLCRLYDVDDDTATRIRRLLHRHQRGR